MPKNLLNKLINDEVNPDEVYEWIFMLNNQQQECLDISNKFRCTRAEFIEFLLNFIHEDLPNFSDKIGNPHDGKLQTDSSIDNKDTSVTSTPKTPKIRPDSQLHFTSPVSPIYKSHNSFSTTPKMRNKSSSSLCLGDFITPQIRKKRITPTNPIQSNASFQKSQNSFNFNKSAIEEVSHDRSSLVEEKLKILSRTNLTSPGKICRVTSSISQTEIEPQVDSVTFRQQIDSIIRIYVKLIDNDYVLNINSEIYFLISLLLKKQSVHFDCGSPLKPSDLFSSMHNVTYFAAKTLESQLKVLFNYDKVTLKLLCENQRLSQFNPDLVEKLTVLPAVPQFIETFTENSNVCFNSDTDNRENFPNDPSFHAFRKQRDLFYEILRLWELNHHNNGFSYNLCLGGKIRMLLSLNADPTNLVHFARLFKSQLLSTCKNNIQCLDVEAQKMNRLTNRCVTKDDKKAGFNSVPEFAGSEEFYKDFILTAFDLNFNRHLCDALISHLLELNETNFDSEENDVDLSTKKLFYSTVKTSRLLAKFLGFIDSLPYKNRQNFYLEHLIDIQVEIRKEIRPNFDVAKLLNNSQANNSIILCIPWLVEYLSMLDFVSLRLPYYKSLLDLLSVLYKTFEGPAFNKSLVKFLLGWFFELPHVPQMKNNPGMEKSNGFSIVKTFPLDRLNIVDQNVIYLCCPYLDELKKLLRRKVTDGAVAVRHITPVTALQSPAEGAKKKLEQQLEEAFFNGHPISLRKTVDFVSERVASICVKHICGDLVPEFKKDCLITFKELSESEKDANRFASQSLDDLIAKCDKEADKILTENITKALTSLLPLDALEQTSKVAIGITKKYAWERVKQWRETHLTTGIFVKDLTKEMNGTKKERRPNFLLPPEGSKPTKEGTVTPAHLLERIRVMCVCALEKGDVTDKQLVDLLDITLESIKERGDMNECVMSTICVLYRDLSYILMVHHDGVISNRIVLSKLVEIWKCYKGGKDLFKNLFCPRNFKILSHSARSASSWKCFAQLCCHLLRNNLLTRDSFESQCLGIFRSDLEEVTLENTMIFFRSFVDFYGDAGQFTWLLDFLSDYCQDL